MKKIFFVVNNKNEFNFKELILKYLPNVDVSIGKVLPINTKKYDLIILWSYQKIIKKLPQEKNVILFHSSDLPEGKGWAPIYNTIVRKKKYFTISGIIANEKVDSGNIIVKAKFKMKDNYTAKYLRMWDHEISIMMIEQILKKKFKKFEGIKQSSKGSTYTRRFNVDNEINTQLPISEIIDHLRGCEENHPAFFYYKKNKYLISVEPETKPDFPPDLEISFFDEK